VAIKNKNNWQLLQPADYFASNDGASHLPKCDVLKQYKIPASLESFCIDAADQAVTNDQ
jgi:hypothetical protein